MRKHKLLIMTLAVLVLSAVSIYSAGKVSSERQNMITTALSLTGTKYRWGGTKPETGLDCSGFIGYVFRESCGVNLPRTAHEMYKKCEIIPKSKREPGDLMFFKSNMDADKITHVGIYCGKYHGKIKHFEGKRVFISAVSDGPKTGVVLTLIDEKYWKDHFFAYGRVLPATERL